MDIVTEVELVYSYVQTLTFGLGLIERAQASLQR